MGKRKLNRRQKWRIEKIQSEKAERAERKRQQKSDQIPDSSLGSEQTGLVIAHFGQQVEVEAETADQEKARFRCFVRANLDSLVTGDRVVWRANGPDSGVVEARMERQSLLQRPDNYGQLKPVAANIDLIVIVAAVVPLPYPELIDRYLVAAETLNITPTLLFNKEDLIDEVNRSDIETLVSRYRKLGYEVHFTNAHDPASCEDNLLAWLRPHTSVFVGQSGVGKSSLIKSILDIDEIRIGALSEFNSKGKHTTTTARLFHIPGGGHIVDSPGIREFGLWHIEAEALLEGFVEFRPFLGHCRFRDCQHENEPGCALKQALEDGAIDPERMRSFRRIRATLDDIETHT